MIAKADNKIWSWAIITTLLAFGLGSLFHFLYQWSGNLLMIGLFFPMNESIWEHLKLTFYPILIVWFLCSRSVRLERPLTWIHNLVGSTISILISSILIIAIYYSFRYAFNMSGIVLDLIAYFLGMYLGQLVGAAITFERRLSTGYAILCLCYLIPMLLLFAFCSLYPLGLPIFQQP